MPDNYDTLFLALTFIVPGFVYFEVSAWFMAQREGSDQRCLYRYLGISFLNYAFWVWLIYLVGNDPRFVDHPVRVAIAWFLIGFVSPALAALVVARIRQGDRVRRALNRLGFRTIYPPPTAWEARFSALDQALVRVTLEDGSKIRGMFASASHASSDPDNCDLYLERVFGGDEHGAWEPIPRSRGMWIRADAIRHVEFLGNE